MVFVCTWPLFYVGKLDAISDGDDHSILIVNVYQKHTWGKAELIVMLTHTVSGVMQKFKDGGKRST